MGIKDFSLNNLPPAKQILLFAVLALALGGVFYTFYLRGPIEERRALEAEVGQLEASVAQANEIASRLNRFKQELLQLEKRLHELRKILPVEKETPLVLKSVQQMAVSSNLNIIKFNPQPVVPRAFYSDWPILMQVQGSYDGIGLFFEKIGRYTRIINVDEINIKGLEDASDTTRTVDATCTATTFMFSEAQLVEPER